MLLYVRPFRAVGLILDSGRFSIALGLAILAGCLFALPIVMREVALDDEIPGIPRMPLGSVFPPVAISLILLAVVFVPVAVIVMNKLEGTGAAGVVLPRDYMPVLVCHLMAYAATLLLFGVFEWIPEFPATPLYIVIFLYFSFLSVCILRTTSGTGFGRAIATTASALVALAAGQYAYSFVRDAMYFLASPFVLYYLYIMFGQGMGSQLRGFGGGLSSRQRMRQLLEFAAVNPHDADAPYQLGLIYQQRRAFTQSREFFEKSIAIDPKEPEAQYQLGRVLRATSDPAAALEHLKIAAAIDNKLAQSEVLREIGAAFLDLERNEEARDILRDYTGRRNFDPEGLYLFGLALSRMNDAPAAREALLQAIEAARTAPPQRRRQVGQWAGKASKLLRQLA